VLREVVLGPCLVSGELETNQFSVWIAMLHECVGKHLQRLIIVRRREHCCPGCIKWRQPSPPTFSPDNLTKSE
jgi:hypothetical protein